MWYILVVMTSKEIVLRRLASQGLAAGSATAGVGGCFSSAEEVVRWMGCVQAQDYAMGKWGIGLRAPGVGDAEIDAAFDAGRILRTHVLRPTWHFVLPEDIEWMVRLTGPRVRAGALSMQRQLGIDKAVLLKSKKVLTKALIEPMTRTELAVLFRRAKINTDDIRMSFLMMDAELEGLICSGPRKGKQFTYRLLTERGLDLSGDAALGELAWRYFVSRGPATVGDLAWWGGLSLAQAKRGLEVVRGRLGCEVVDGREYFFDAAGSVSLGVAAVLLLPAWDEYTVAYKDRSHFLHADHVGRSSYGLKPVIVVKGRVVGVWRRVLERERVIVEVSAFGDLSRAVVRAIGVAAKGFGNFLGRGVEVVYG